MADFEVKAEQEIILERPVEARMHDVLNVRLHRQPIGQLRAIGEFKGRLIRMNNVARGELRLLNI